MIDRVVSIPTSVPAERWAAFYAEEIKGLKPGVTEFVIHLGYDDAEMRAFSNDNPAWGAAWLQRDFDFFTGPEFRRLLKENGAELVTWREIGKLLSKPRPTR